MKTLLHIQSSLFAGRGQSSQLSADFVARWQARHPDGKVITLDLAASPIPHLDGDAFNAFVTAAEDRTPAQQQAVDKSDALIADLKAADVLVIGLPTYNLGMPSQLKSWFDYIARAGITFRYSAAGPEGLVTGKQAYVFATRGGQYAHTPADRAALYVRDMLGFIGIDDVHFVYAEGLAMGDAPRAQGLAAARHALAAIEL